MGSSVLVVQYCTCHSHTVPLGILLPTSKGFTTHLLRVIIPTTAPPNLEHIKVAPSIAGSDHRRRGFYAKHPR